jgi:uncharacterized protein (TIRG00374 family)
MPDPQVKTGASRFVKIGVPLLVSALALWLVMRQLDFQAVGDAFRQLSVGSMALIMVCFLVGLVLRGLTCWIILGGKISFLNTFWAMNLGYLLNTVIPLRLGEFGRAAFLAKRGNQRVSYLEAFASIVAERILDLLVGFSFLVFSLFFLIQNDALKKVTWIGILILVLVIVFIFYATRNKDQVVLWLRGRFNQSKLMVNKAIPALEQLLIGFQFFVKPGRFALAYLILAISWSFSMIEFLILQRAILQTSERWWPMVVIPASAFVNALPSAPAGLGVFEAGTVGAYALVGVDKAPALAMALVVHLVQIVIPAILGVIALLKTGQSLSSMVDMAANIQLRKEL